MSSTTSSLSGELEATATAPEDDEEDGGPSAVAAVGHRTIGALLQVGHLLLHVGELLLHVGELLLQVGVLLLQVAVLLLQVGQSLLAPPSCPFAENICLSESERKRVQINYM